MDLSDDMLARERVANRPKHWVRAVTACNSRCLFCLDSDTPRNVFIPDADVKAEIDRGRDALGATKIVISGGEASLHPQFHEFVRYARERGYERVQTVTNGYRFAEAAFFRDAIEAGLGEITFSIHGHTEELHDRLTGTPGAFKRIVKSIVRAVRTPGLIVNVDVCINKQNVGTLDKLIELCFSLGVTEYDLLHVIPQAAAFENRDELFYDPREYLDVLHKVFRLNRHKSLVVWTNRFPVPFLEGLEDLIQDPHKMLDEINGRRFQVRRYLDGGAKLDCRDPERCVHCFIEPMCTHVDRTVRALHDDTADIWQIGDGTLDPELRARLPFGCRWLGVEATSPAALDPDALPEGASFHATFAEAGEIPSAVDDARHVFVADTEEKLRAWLPSSVSLEVQLSEALAPVLRELAPAIAEAGERVTLVQPSFERYDAARGNDLRDPAAFFSGIGARMRVAGLPACLAPGQQLVASHRILGPHLFNETTGRLEIRDIARDHIVHGYRVKSLRCRECPAVDRCAGAHINWVRDQGLGALMPLEGSWAEDATAQLEALVPTPDLDLAHGRPPEPGHPSLPGRPEPAAAAPDPLSVIAQEQLLRRKRRRAGLPVEPTHR